MASYPRNTPQTSEQIFVDTKFGRLPTTIVKLVEAHATGSSDWQDLACFKASLQRALDQIPGSTEVDFLRAVRLFIDKAGI